MSVSGTKCLIGGFGKHLEFHDSASINQVHRNTADGGTDDDYVANKNSDVFHFPDCKWTHKIKPKNMITFSSVQEAKSQHFVPCRDCRPDSSDTFQNSTSGNEKMQISNYL